MIRQLQPRWQRWLARRIPPAASVILDHRRIFILPTRVGVAFMGVLLLMLLAAINYQSNLAFGLTFLLGSVWLVAILHTWRNLGGLRLQAGNAANAPAVFLGEQARLLIRLESGGREHQAIALGWPRLPLQTLDVAALASQDCELGLPTTHRGWLRPGRMRVESRFPLGLLRVWSWVDLNQAVLVYPRPLQGDLPLSGAAADTPQEGLQARGPGVDDYQGLRAYQPGDSRRRLHWKAYSRGQGLMIKDFTAFTGSELCLDFAALDGDTEQRLSRLCHWVLELSRREQAFILQLPDARLGPDQGEAHRERCLRALALYGLPT